MEILILSHGDLAKAALESVEMIAGKQTHFTALTLHPGEGLADFYQKLKETVLGKKGQEILIFTDIQGGTPCNAATQLLLQGTEGRVEVFAGFNLPLLLQMATAKDQTLTEASQWILNNGSRLLVHVNERLQKGEEDDEY